MEIRNYQDTDHVEIADLFHGAVHAIPTSVYSKKELEAWAPSPPDYNHWKERLATKKPVVALKNNIIIGFIELESNGHIDCLYVHKNYQGSGVASSLLRYVQAAAHEKGITKLYVEASKVAMPLFKKHGFKLGNTNIVNLRGQSLTNCYMSLGTKP